MKVQNFKDKVVVITGAASGIGLATAHAFAGQGARLVLGDRDGRTLAVEAGKLGAKGHKVLAQACDVTDPEACQLLVDAGVNAFGRIDLLFNNAGITQRSLFEHTRLSVIETVMAVNFFGSIYMTKAALPHLIDAGGAIVVNESIAGVAPLLGRCGYAASKHALHGFFTSLRCELRHKGVHVMIVCPGFIKTNLQTRALGGDGNPASHAQTRVGRQQTPEFVADQIIKGVQQKKPLLVFTFFGKLGYWVSRLWPNLYERLMTRQFRSELHLNPDRSS